MQYRLLEDRALRHRIEQRHVGIDLRHDFAHRRQHRHGVAGHAHLDIKLIHRTALGEGSSLPRHRLFGDAGVFMIFHDTDDEVLLGVLRVADNVTYRIHRVNNECVTESFGLRMVQELCRQ